MCVSPSYFFLLLLVLGGAGQAYEVAELVEGVVEAEAVNHYTVDVTGVVVVALLSEEGDADLYASTETREPSHANYQLSSSSCGLDLVVLPASKGAGSQRVYLSVVGHSRHARSRYTLAIIPSSSHDIDKYQVWELDPETKHRVLLVSYDPLQIANDNTLHQLLEQLQGNSPGVKGDPIEGAWGRLKHIAEWTLYLFFEALKILIEILL